MTDAKEKVAPGKPRQSQRLDAAAWADAALTELATQGIDGVRVEVLAKRLGVTKGSFYWHFKDRDALLARMLEQWRKRATLALIQRIDRQWSSPVERLRQLLRLPMKGERAMLAADTELALRLWGRSDQRARHALQEVDEFRLCYIERLLVESGVSTEDARARAILFYSYQRVATSLVAADDSELIERCERLLVSALRA